MTDDIPMAYDFYIDSRIEDMQNDPRPKHPEDIDREVQHLRGIMECLLRVLLKYEHHWSYDDWNEMAKIQRELKGGQ